jgi:hypothetical protein
VRPLPLNPNLDHLKYQAKDLLKGHAAHDPSAAQRIREFHPNFKTASDAQVFSAEFRLTSAQLAIAREHGFPSWSRLKARIEKPTHSDSPDLRLEDRIVDAVFRQAVDLLDAGKTGNLRAHLKEHPSLVHQRVFFEGRNYFNHPTLLEFIAENPIRHGTMPANAVAIAKVILDAGADRSALNETLLLVCSGRVPRECGMQEALIDLLCDKGADAESAAQAALVNGEFEAVNALVRRGVKTNLAIAAALGRTEDAIGLLAGADHEDRHRAFALASQFGHVEIVRMLIDAGENPDRYNPLGTNSHSTPLHQAALAGHDKIVRLLVERGARVDLKDILWQGTPADWAKQAGNKELEAYLRTQENAKGGD